MTAPTSPREADIELNHMIDTLRGRKDDKLCLDAADEIKRLRAETRTLRNWCVTFFEAGPSTSPREVDALLTEEVRAQLAPLLNRPSVELKEAAERLWNDDQDCLRPLVNGAEMDAAMDNAMRRIEIHSWACKGFDAADLIEAVLTRLSSALSAPLSGHEAAVAWRVKDFADGWIYFDSPKKAYEEADATGALLQPLFLDANLAALSAPPARIDAERQIIANKAREWAGHYKPHSDGRNTFVLLAEWIESRVAAPPAGMVLVPEEPTFEMLLALDNCVRVFEVGSGANTAYRAMLSAAPSPTAGEGE